MSVSRPTLLARLLLGAVHAYRAVLSPLMGGHCRFHPTCSAYALEAIRTHGAIRGGRLTIARLLRCHPFAKSGYDPVPFAPSDKDKLI